MVRLPSPEGLGIKEVDEFFQALLTNRGKFNYVCREILEFLDFATSLKERRSIVFSRPSEFIDDYMVKMEENL